MPEQIRQAEALLEWCRKERRRELHSGAALRLGPYCVRSAESFDRAIAVLERTGWAVPVEGGMVLDGAHRRRVWRIRWEDAI